MSNKKIIILPFLIFLLTLSCENDVEIVAPGNDLPVIHFILDPFEDEYYATVTKIGIDRKGFAEFSDSTELFYPDGISLSLELWNDSIRLWYSDFRPVQKTKEPGLFPSETGFLYKSNNIIPKRESSYGFLEGYPHFSYFRIILNGDEFEKTAYSRVSFGEYPVIVQPHFVDQKVHLYGREPFTIKWNAGQTVDYFDLYFTFKFSEYQADEKISTDSIQFLYAQNIHPQSGGYKIMVNPDNFFSRLAAELSPSLRPGAYRKMNTFDICLVGGDSNFADYMMFDKLAVQPGTLPWTNITNGIGVFAIKYITLKRHFKFHQNSRDSLALGKFTKDLGFVRW